MNKFFWHSLTSEQQDILIGKITWKELTTKYQQPKWCAYPDALSELGCWSLLKKAAMLRAEDFEKIGDSDPSETCSHQIFNLVFLS